MTQNLLTFQLSGEEVNLVLTGLGELPAKQTINLILRIQAQAQAQMAPPAEQPVAEGEAPKGSDNKVVKIKKEKKNGKSKK